MNRVLLSVLALTSLNLPAVALEKYLCVADQSTGFKWSGSDWVIAQFQIASEKFVVREVDEYDSVSGKVNFEVVKLGEDLPASTAFEAGQGDRSLKHARSFIR
jgi:hypothetical protein